MNLLPRSRRSSIAGALLVALAIGGVSLVVLSITSRDSNTTPQARNTDRTLAPTPGGAWSTDQANALVPLKEFRSGGVPRDGIPSIDSPRFVDAKDADFVGDLEPVIAYEGRAYPLQVLTWHEIVNDVVDGMPIAVTFCPLCNTAIVFDRRLDNTTLEFGVSGMLRHNDLVMYDRQTQSWWQQFDGRALVGELAGKRLDLLPSTLVSFETFTRLNPDGLVLTRDTGYERDYGRNPYAGYDSLNTPALFGTASANDDRLSPKARVILVPKSESQAARVYPFDELRKDPAIEDGALILFYSKGTVSALDESDIRGSRDVGSATAYDRAVDGRALAFEPVDDGSFRDVQTDSTWNLAGQATAGPLKGRSLTPVEHVNIFWFAAAAFVPNVDIYEQDA